MLHKKKFMIAALVACGAASIAIAEQYVDYNPQPGMWRINAIEVDPNHIDDYLTGLRKSQVPAFEVLKKHGIIDDYKFLVREGYTKGRPSVLIATHVTSASMLEPNKARDQAIEKEILAKFSKQDGDAAVAGYEKYRQFLDDSLWTEMKMVR